MPINDKISPTFLFLKNFIMIKLVLGFIAIAAAALYFLSKGGDIDMGGEKHGIETHEAAPKAAASAPVLPVSATK
jgi:hypothetical protein